MSGVPPEVWSQGNANKFPGRQGQSVGAFINTPFLYLIDILTSEASSDGGHTSHIINVIF